MQFNSYVLSALHTARTLILIVILFAAGLVSAASNPPTPAPAESTGKPKANTTQVNQSSNSSNNVTKSSSVIVVVPKSPDINIKAADKTENYSRYSSPEWWMVYLTAALALITGALAYFTACLWNATKTMVDRSDSAAKWQYITTHRPRLIIRRISLDGGDGSYFALGSRIPKVQFIVANIGGSCATIIESNATFTKLEEQLPAIPPYSIDSSSIKCIIREAGQSDPPEILYIEDTLTIQDISSWNNKNITHGEDSLYYFFGYIQYRDDVGIVRRMTFCRRYNAGTKRFTEVNDSEYEYSD